MLVQAKFENKSEPFDVYYKLLTPHKTYVFDEEKISCMEDMMREFEELNVETWVEIICLPIGEHNRRKLNEARGNILDSRSHCGGGELFPSYLYASKARSR